jgi:hypothetical protein
MTRGELEEVLAQHPGTDSAELPTVLVSVVVGVARLPSSESARPVSRGRRQDVDLSRIINGRIAGFVGDRCVHDPNNRASADSWEGVGQLLFRGLDTVGHQRNAQAGLRRGEGVTHTCSKAGSRQLSEASAARAATHHRPIRLTS